MEHQIKETEELNAVAKSLLTFVSHEKIFLFFGEMGAGKTTFIKSICKELGVNDSVSSPTYSIVNEYDSLNGKIFHFDFYRLKNEFEAFDLGFEEYLYSDHYCLIEWPEKIENLWPEKYIKVTMAVTENAKRLITAELIEK